MFKVKLDNCGGEIGKINIEVVLTVSKTQLAFVINKAQEGFRQIEVVDNETGELVFSSYTSPDWFLPKSTEGEVLDEIQQIMEDIE
jgi:hypothetical protein